MWSGYQWLVLIARLVEEVVVREAAVCRIFKVGILARQLKNSPRTRPAEMLKGSTTTPGPSNLNQKSICSRAAEKVFSTDPWRGCTRDNTDRVGSLRTWGSELKIWGCGFRVSGFGFRISG